MVAGFAAGSRTTSTHTRGGFGASHQRGEREAGRLTGWTWRDPVGRAPRARGLGVCVRGAGASMIGGRRYVALVRCTENFGAFFLGSTSYTRATHGGRQLYLSLDQRIYSYI